MRAAWRRIAAATHPDREDGGDPARFGAAAAAYVLLRTSFGRGEALADLADGAGRPRPGPGGTRGRVPRRSGTATGTQRAAHSAHRTSAHRDKRVPAEPATG